MIDNNVIQMKKFISFLQIHYFILSSYQKKLATFKLTTTTEQNVPNLHKIT